MKVAKFGTIKGGIDGTITISEFLFINETPAEAAEEIGPHNAIPAIICHLSNLCEMPVTGAPLEQQAEIIVLRAIQKAGAKGGA